MPTAAILRRGALCLAVCAGIAGAVPAIASAGSISGKVTAEAGGAPIAGIRVCQYESKGAIEESCTETDASGNYSFSSLTAGSYLVGFSGEASNAKWVNEIYDNRRYSWEADLVTIGASQSISNIDAALAEGGSISGTVTDAESGDPIAGIRACALDEQGIPRCASSGANGEYQINGLRSGKYSVEFEGGNQANYLREFYENAATWASATEVEVIAPDTTSNISQELSPGAQILGHVSTIGTGAPAAGILVCAMEPAPGEHEGCDVTDDGGEYAIRSLPAGTYLVAFGLEYLPFGQVAGQWWQGASSKADATPLTIVPPETRTDIDGQVKAWPPTDPETTELPSIGPPPLPQTKKEPAKKCRSGFRLKRVKGKQRCVRKHKRHRPRRRR